MRKPDLSQAKWLREPGLKKLLSVLAKKGEGRVVGGAVRNELMGLPVLEVDIATDLSPETVIDLCRTAGLGVHPTGIEHGTVTVVSGGMAFEVTTLRKDVLTDGRRAVVAFAGDWAEDALRRDFTINALYVDVAGKIYDYVGGLGDIRKRRVKFIGRPTDRIKEDYLRILRFFRFHAQLGKGALDSAGFLACTKLASGMKQLSAERVRQELMKLLQSDGAAAVLQKMASAGILKRIFPHTENWRAIKRLPGDPLLRLMVLAADPLSLKDSLRLTSKEMDRLRACLDAPTIGPRLSDHERRRILYFVGPQTWSDAVHIGWANSRSQLSDPAWAKLLAAGGQWLRPTFPITGRMLIERGVAPGPALGQILRALEDWWIASDFKPDKNELLDHFGKQE